MDRNELTLAIAGALVGAFLLGWVLRWFFGRLNATGPRSVARTADLAAQLHAAEEAKARAEWRAIEAEEEATRRVAELQAEVETSRAEVAKAESATEEIRAVRVTHRVGLKAEPPAQLARTAAFRFHLNADEGGTGALRLGTVLLEPVGVDQTRSIVFGLGQDGPEEVGFGGHGASWRVKVSDYSESPSRRYCSSLNSVSVCW